ncbi:uncharacterized protein [Lolium perenne]|uniref:uncharacterized protein n=1 Tax=Lolium perenne TaxID=4522 RepID=UPI0021F50502|nr:uncharacterized protein LOC127305625 [Lolium perenne]XP_051192088.1 uncharacterized protein LOC127305625 [Lolium perenne]XP_051192089.1 uncharacterized protein LOC127305625 [Lolium perenne]
MKERDQDHQSCCGLLKKVCDILVVSPRDNRHAALIILQPRRTCFLKNRRVVFIMNVKPGNLPDVMPAGMISSLTGNLQEHFSDNSLQWLLVEFGLIGFMGSILGIPFIRYDPRDGAGLRLQLDVEVGAVEAGGGDRWSWRWPFFSGDSAMCY